MNKKIKEQVEQFKIKRGVKEMVKSVLEDRF